MHIHRAFPTPIVTCDVTASGDFVATLRDVILARMAVDPGVRHSNEGGWQSDDDFLDWSGADGRLLGQGVREIVDQFTYVQGPEGPSRRTLQWRVNAWANVSLSGHANALHSHPGAYWSAVFYVDDGGIDGRDGLGGALEFVDPRGPVALMHAPDVKMGIEGCLSAGLGERLLPKTGQLVIFPAWLSHSVSRYTGAGRRISVAFNFGLG